MNDIDIANIALTVQSETGGARRTVAKVVVQLLRSLGFSVMTDLDCRPDVFPPDFLRGMAKSWAEEGATVHVQSQTQGTGEIPRERELVPLGTLKKGDKFTMRAVYTVAAEDDTDIGICYCLTHEVDCGGLDLRTDLMVEKSE